MEDLVKPHLHPPGYCCKYKNSLNIYCAAKHSSCCTECCIITGNCQTCVDLYAHIDGARCCIKGAEYQHFPEHLGCCKTIMIVCSDYKKHPVTYCCTKGVSSVHLESHAEGSCCKKPYAVKVEIPPGIWGGRGVAQGIAPVIPASPETPGTTKIFTHPRVVKKMTSADVASWFSKILTLGYTHLAIHKDDVEDLDDTIIFQKNSTKKYITVTGIKFRIREVSPTSIAIGDNSSMAKPDEPPLAMGAVNPKTEASPVTHFTKEIWEEFAHVFLNKNLAPLIKAFLEKVLPRRDYDSSLQLFLQAKPYAELLKVFLCTVVKNTPYSILAALVTHEGYEQDTLIAKTAIELFLKQ